MDAIIQGTFADMKTVKTRKTLQIIIECPIEMGEQVVKAFGFPDPSKEVNVVIARIQDKSVHDVVKPVSKAGEGKLLAQDSMLGDFIGCNQCEAENSMKYILEIKSCSELIDGSDTYERFKVFRKDFYDWKRATEQEEYYAR